MPKIGLIGAQFRFVVVAVMVMVALTTGRPVAAQENGTVTTGDEVAQYSVTVGCATDEVAGTSWCSFVPVSNAGATVTGLTIPGDSLCAPIVDLGGAAWSDFGLTGSGEGVSVGFAGSVSASGEAVYSLSVDDGVIAAVGPGIVCATAAEAVEPEPALEAPTLEAPPAADSEAPPVADSEATPVAEEATAVEAPIGEPDSQSGEAPLQEAGEIAAAEVVDVTVNILAYDCETDPGANDPAGQADCAAAAGVTIAGAANGVPLADVVTDGGGAASIVAPDGSSLVLSEDRNSISTSYSPKGDGVADLIASEGALVVFVHLPDDVVGRLQITTGFCPTSGESRVEFRVIQPQTLQAAADPGCQASPGASAVITGAGLGSGLTIYTDANGNWRGFLPIGSYGVSAESGDSTTVAVADAGVSVVIMIQYLSDPLGVLSLSRQLCADAALTETSLTGSFDAPVLGEDCEYVDGDVLVEAQAQIIAVDQYAVTLGADGKSELEVEPGSYLVTDIASGESIEVDVAATSRVYVAITESIEGIDDTGDGDGDGDGDDPDNGDGSGDDDGSGPDDDGSGPGDNDGPSGGDPDGSGDDSDGDGSNVSNGDDIANADTGAEGDSGDEYWVTTLPDTGAGDSSGFGNPGVTELLGILVLIAGSAGLAGSRRKKAA